MKKLGITIAMASYNEENAIVEMINSIKQFSNDYDIEIILVDSSSDNTPQIAKEMGAVVFSQKPQGHGIALRTALNKASKDIIITADCDNTYPLNYIPKLASLIQSDNLDLISCNRLNDTLKKEMPFPNKIANMLFALLVSKIYRFTIHDVTTGMFCLKKELVKKLNLENNYSLPCEIIIKSRIGNFNCREINIPYRIRIGEVTLNRWKSGIAYIKCILKYRFNLGFQSSSL